MAAKLPDDQFANLVRLTDAETQARRRVVGRIQESARSIWRRAECEAPARASPSLLGLMTDISSNLLVCAIMFVRSTVLGIWAGRCGGRLSSLTSMK